MCLSSSLLVYRCTSIQEGSLTHYCSVADSFVVKNPYMATCTAFRGRLWKNLWFGVEERKLFPSTARISLLCSRLQSLSRESRVENEDAPPPAGSMSRTGTTRGFSSDREAFPEFLDVREARTGEARLADIGVVAPSKLVH